MLDSFLLAEAIIKRPVGRPKGSKTKNRKSPVQKKPNCICKGCGREFYAPPSVHRKFHSRQCMMDYRVKTSIEKWKEEHRRMVNA